MGKKLVTFFSAESGKTARAGKDFATAIDADVFEIVPEKIYTEADLNWRNPLARCNREHMTKKDVPVKGNVENFADYDTVYIGFPIWYGCAPNVVNTFCKGYDWHGKQVYIFATSGGGGIGKSEEKLAPFIEGAEIMDARLIKSAEGLSDWKEE